MKVRGLLVKVTDKPGFVDVVEEEDELENWYDLLGCELIDIVSRKIGDRVFTIICDDEGIYRQPFPSALSGSPGGQQEVMLVGNLFICKDRYDEASQETMLDSLSDDDMIYILKNHIGILMSKDPHEKAFFPCVNNVDYIVDYI